MTVEEMLTKRFVEAIRKSFDPCPLIGPKWFQYHGAANPPYFQFLGLAKLSKALGAKSPWVAKRVLANLDVRGLDCKVEVADESKINMKFKTAPEAPKE